MISVVSIFSGIIGREIEIERSTALLWSVSSQIYIYILSNSLQSKKALLIFYLL